MMLNKLLFSFLLDRYLKMVSPQNDDTQGGPPPPSDATARQNYINRWGYSMG